MPVTWCVFSSVKTASLAKQSDLRPTAVEEKTAIYLHNTIFLKENNQPLRDRVRLGRFYAMTFNESISLPWFFDIMIPSAHGRDFKPFLCRVNNSFHITGSLSCCNQNGGDDTCFWNWPTCSHRQTMNGRIFSSTFKRHWLTTIRTCSPRFPSSFILKCRALRPLNGN